MEGWIRLHRQIIESTVFAHPIALKIWVWCLCKATYADRKVQLNVGNGFTIVDLKRGQFIFGRHKAEEELSIDGSTIYKWIQKFKTDFDMIEIESNNKFSIISILNFSEFQDKENIKVTTTEQQDNNNVATEEQQRNTNNTLNTLKESKEYSDQKIFDLLSNPDGLFVVVKEAGLIAVKIHQQSFDKYLDGTFGVAYEGQKMALRNVKPPIEEFFKKNNGNVYNNPNHIWSAFKKLWLTQTSKSSKNGSNKAF